MLRKALPHEIPAPEPKLIANAGEWVRVIDFGTRTGKGTYGAWKLNHPYKLKIDLDQEGDFEVYEDCLGKSNGWCNVWESGMKFEPCPAPRTPIGEIDGVKVYYDTVSWYIDLDDLWVYECKYPEYGIEDLKSESESYTKNIFTPEAVNVRLLEEVEKKAKERKFTIEEIKPYFTGYYKVCSFESYVIELIEKEFNVRYL